MKKIIFLFIFLIFWIFGCHDNAYLPHALDNKKEEFSPSPIKKESEIIVLRGELHFKENHWKKTLESWDGLEFFLVNEQGLQSLLTASDEVSREKLISFANKKVEVKAFLYQPTLDPNEIVYPTDKDGQPLKRTPRFKVVEIKLID